MCIRGDSLTREKNSVRENQSVSAPAGVLTHRFLKKHFGFDFIGFFFQNKYKEEGKGSLCQSFYSQLPETSESQFVKGVSELQSEVRLRSSSATSGTGGLCWLSTVIQEDELTLVW